MDSAERAACLAKRSGWCTLDVDPTERQRLASEAVTIAESTGNTEVLLPALEAQAQALVAVGDCPPLLRLADRLGHLSDSTYENYWRSMARYFRLAAQFIANDFDGVRRLQAEMQAADWSLDYWKSALVVGAGVLGLLIAAAYKFRRR